MVAAGEIAGRHGLHHPAWRFLGYLVRPFSLFGAARGLAVAFLMLLVVLRVLDPAPIELLRLKAFDYYQQLAPRTDPRRPVVVVDIDEVSLDRFGQWPWPRTIVAELLNKITLAGGVGIGLDVVFAEPDRTSPDLIADHIPELSDSARAEVKSVRNYDEVLADTLAASRIVLGESAIIAEGRTPDLSAVPNAPIATLGADPAPFLFAFPKLLPNVPVLEEAAAGRGMFTIKSDPDGIVRRVPLLMKASGLTLPSLSVELLRVATGQRGILVKADEYGVNSVVVAGAEIPTDRNARLWVHFGPHDPGRYISAAEVIEGDRDLQVFAGKLVLVGTSSAGLFDLRATPVDGSMPGVEIHAQVLENILTQSYLKRPNLLLGAEITTTVIAGVAIILLVPILGALTVLGLGGLLAAAALGVTWYAFDAQQTLIDVTFPLGATFAVFALLVFVNYYREERQKQQIRGAFGQYLSPTLVEELASDPHRLTLGGETREMTILFSDVRDFTSISESFRADPQGLTRLMNRFLTPLSNAIMERRGTIDKYMGDAIMAIWNAPLDDADHAGNACLAGLEMRERIDALNALRREEAEREGADFRPLNVGVGINTGECVVGNMGSEMRFDYTVMGDAVNLASRLEGQTKEYGVRAIVGSDTAGRVGERFALVELDLIRVKGKTEPDRIFALVGDADTTKTDAFRSLAGHNAEMLAHYRARAFEAALAALETCRPFAGEFGLTGFYDLYEARIRAFIEAPPPEDWDGVYVAVSK